jgi:hypothetical protein
MIGSTFPSGGAGGRSLRPTTAIPITNGGTTWRRGASWRPGTTTGTSPRDPGASYAKRFRLIGLKPHVEPLTDDGRPVLDLIEAAIVVFGSKREAAEALGLKPRTAYYVLDLGFDLTAICPNAARSWKTLTGTGNSAPKTAGSVIGVSTARG